MKYHIDETAAGRYKRREWNVEVRQGTGDINARKQQQLRLRLCFVKWEKMTTGEGSVGGWRAGGKYINK